MGHGQNWPEIESRGHSECERLMRSVLHRMRTILGLEFLRQKNLEKKSTARQSRPGFHSELCIAVPRTIYNCIRCHESAIDVCNKCNDTNPTEIVNKVSRYVIDSQYVIRYTLHHRPIRSVRCVCVLFIVCRSLKTCIRNRG